MFTLHSPELCAFCLLVWHCRLILEWNALGVWDEAFSIFCEGLGSNGCLTQLDLRNNQINHQGAAELSLALKRNGTLQELGELAVSKMMGFTLALISRAVKA